jgi:hypothetical protein
MRALQRVFATGTTTSSQLQWPLSDMQAAAQHAGHRPRICFGPRKGWRSGAAPLWPSRERGRHGDQSDQERRRPRTHHCSRPCDSRGAGETRVRRASVEDRLDVLVANAGISKLALIANRRRGLMAATPPGFGSSSAASTPMGSSRPPSRCRRGKPVRLRLKHIPRELQSNRISPAADCRFLAPSWRIA